MRTGQGQPSDSFAKLKLQRHKSDSLTLNIIHLFTDFTVGVHGGTVVNIVTSQHKGSTLLPTWAFVCMFSL